MSVSMSVAVCDISEANNVALLVLPIYSVIALVIDLCHNILTHQ